MPINPPSPTNLLQMREPKPATETLRKRSDLPSETPSKGKAKFSASREKIEELTAALARVPEIREERVQALRKALKAGAFNVSDEEIADAMISDLFK
ncbi:MAG: flagellar biosynthesis anti-sigma factor FlgM [Acidobacteria bacterium]|nr:flagellar biosynthesis anti-sigma factor FlgM [Acidobacteriota bacterium]